MSSGSALVTIERMKRGISIVIPTHNGGLVFEKCLKAINTQDYTGETQLIIIDSGSSDGTWERAEKAGALVRHIDKHEFHHARTRNEALSDVKHDCVVYTVQDAIPYTKAWLSALEHSLLNHDVGAVYTGQMPHDDAELFVRFLVDAFNDTYGHEPLIQFLESRDEFERMPYKEAYKRIHLDNVCAIYKTDLLKGSPFPQVDFAEDMAWATQNMLKGVKVMYQPNVKVKHSHNRTAEYGFRRQVVNSKYCAQIMNRVDEDLSFLTMTDLVLVTGAVSLYADHYRNIIAEEDRSTAGFREKGSTVIKWVQQQYSFKYRIKRFIFDKFGCDRWHQYHQLKRIVDQVVQNIEAPLNYIKATYMNAAKNDLLGVLDQFVAASLGRLYGEYYASSILRNRASDKLERFFEPYLKGI